ncbi:MAG: hypothetical protein ACOCNO_05435, partial [Bacteroidales bacterium]
ITPLTPHGALPLIKQVALFIMSAALGNPSKLDCPRLHDISERDTLINATSFSQGAALGWVQQLGLQPATLVQPTQ